MRDDGFEEPEVRGHVMQGNFFAMKLSRYVTYIRRFLKYA